MRVLIIAHGYPPAFSGGAELRAERTARGLIRAGHTVAVLSAESFPGAENGPATHEHMQDGVHVHHMQLRYDAAGDPHRQEYQHPDVARELARLIATWQPDVIHLFSGYLTGVGVIHTAAEHGVPVLVSLTDYWWLCHRIIMVRTDGSRCDGPSPMNCARCHSEVFRRFRIPSQVARPVVDQLWKMAAGNSRLAASLGMDAQRERWRALSEALGIADVLIAPSNVLADLYIRTGIRGDRMRVLRQGVDLLSCPLRVESPVMRFAYFGQIKHHKGVHTLIEAWALLEGDRPRSLILRGSERGEEQYAQALRDKSGNRNDLTWAPVIDHSLIWKALAEVDVVIVPSRWLENSPNIILEAQAMGVVIIGTDLGGIAELVHHEVNGLLFAPDNADDLALQLQRILDDPAMLAKLRCNLLPFGSFLDEIDEIVALYEHCLGRADTVTTTDAGAPNALEDRKEAHVLLDAQGAARLADLSAQDDTMELRK